MSEGQAAAGVGEAAGDVAVHHAAVDIDALDRTPVEHAGNRFLMTGAARMVGIRDGRRGSLRGWRGRWICLDLRVGGGGEGLRGGVRV